MTNAFNLEDEYGSFLDSLTTHISLMDDEPIEHFGVKGMKWGIRKDRSSNREPLKSLGPDSVTRKTASGEEITLSKDQPTALHKFLGHISKNYREQYKLGASLTIKDGSGKTIGHAQVSKKSDDELNLVWLGINKSSRGQGYATSVMKAGAEFGRQEGFKKLTLEVPGNAPDARHIYEKLGFKIVKEPSAKELEEDFFWGGLTEMEYNFDQLGQTAVAYLEKPDLNELAELVHYGVKGMKWGVRNDRDGAGINPLQTQGSMTVDSGVPQSTKVAAKEVASLVGERYGFHVSAVKTMSVDPSHPDYHPDMIGYVVNNPGKRDGVIHVSHKDVRKPLKDAENTGWFGEGCGTPKAFLTHESAHAIFHSEQTVKNGLLGAKVVGGNMKARDKAIKAAVKQAKRDGVPLHLLGYQISGYAGTAGNREELEAEMFSQYHWSPNPPPFIKVWGQTLHQELGVDDTPFGEVVNHG